MVTPFTTIARHAREVLVIAFVLVPILLSQAQTVPSDPPYSVVDRGAFYRVLQRTVSVTNTATGEVSQQVQSYTELGDGMNYLSNGQWIESQDLVEATSWGAQAVHGQMTATFNSDISTKAAISLTTAAGEVFQSHPLGLFYADSASGKIASIATVQLSQGTLYPPNVLVFSNVLSGLKADLMLVWAKNGYEQNLVLKQSPPRPESLGLSSATTRLQFWTSMDACPAPLEQRPVLLNSGLVDHILIFSGCWFPVGSAFSFGRWPAMPQGQPVPVRLISPSAPDAFPVAKSLVTIEGQTVLIEEINYSDVLPSLSALPQAALWPSNRGAVQLADRGELLPKPSRSKGQAGPVSVASVAYTPEGFLLDYTTLTGNTNGYTFATGNTYYIPNSFITGSGTVTFQNGACIKFGTNGVNTYLLTYGPVSFPYSGQPIIFTSKDDNTYGQIITNSTSQPWYSAAQGLYLYYETISTTVQNSMFRWAKRCVQYDENGGIYNRPSLSSCVFQDSQTGVYANIADDTLYLSSDTECNVTTPIQTASGTVSGSMTVDCGVVSVAMVNDPSTDSSGLDTNKNSQTECSFVVTDTSTVVAAFMNTHLSEYNLGYARFPGIPSPRMTSWAVSANSGVTFTDKGPLPPLSTITNGGVLITNGAPNATQGDAGDPVMAYDPSQGTYGTLYLLTNPSREDGYLGFRLWTSTDKGTNFTLLNTNVPGNGWVGSTDKPMLRVNPTTHALYVAGSTSGNNTWAARSTNSGSSWSLYRSLDSLGDASRGADIVVVPDGTVYVFWLQRTATTNVLRYASLSTNGNWSSTLTLGAINSPNENGSGNLLRSSGGDTNDFFVSNAFPRLAYANGRVYIVYADLPYRGSTIDRGDIFVDEATINWSDHSLTLTAGPRKINNDGTQSDQWDPSIAVNTLGTELFIGYYSRQNDPNNSQIMAYGAKAYITNGLSLATFECVPISPSSFPPLFAGTSTSTSPASYWLYDPVWAQNGVCLDGNAVFGGLYDGTFCPPGMDGPLPGGTGPLYANFCADDYTWAAGDNSFFYFAWCDRFRTNGSGQMTRHDADVKFAKIRQ